MKRKKFIKNLMSVGIGRNAANWAARERSDAAIRMLVQVCRVPGFCAVTGATKTKRGLAFRVKREVEA